MTFKEKLRKWLRGFVTVPVQKEKPQDEEDEENTEENTNEEESEIPEEFLE